MIMDRTVRREVNQSIFSFSPRDTCSPPMKPSASFSNTGILPLEWWGGELGGFEGDGCFEGEEYCFSLVAFCGGRRGLLEGES